MNKTVVPLAGSPDAEDVLRFARSFATRGDGIIYLVHVLDIDTNQWDIWAARRISAESYLDATAQSFPAGAAIETHVLYGHPADCILEFAERVDASMLMLAPRWSEALESFVPHSVSRHLLESSSVPILLVPTGNSSFSGKIETVLLPVPMSHATHDSVLRVLSWLARLDIMVRLVSIMPCNDHPGTEIAHPVANDATIEGYDSLLERAQLNLLSLRRMLTRAGVRSVWEVRYGPIVHEILRAADTTATDLIIFPPSMVDCDSDRSVGSTPWLVAQRSRAPVLVFPHMDVGARLPTDIAEHGRNGDECATGDNSQLIESFS